MPLLSLFTGFWVLLLICLFAIFIWFIVRVKVKRYWFPIIEVIAHKKKIIPDVKLRRPPLLPFLFFLLIVLITLFFGMRPTSYYYEHIGNLNPKAHVFVDMSPSIASHISLKAYVEEIKNLWFKLGKNFSVTLSTSHSSEVLQFTNSEDLDSYLISKGFHRPGIFIGSAIQNSISGGGHDLLVIVSDKDKNSWSDFNWESLNSTMEILFHDISNYKDGSYNVFIESVSNKSNDNSKVMDWQVVVARVGDSQEKKGILKATLNDTQIAKIPWKIDQNRKKSIVDVEIPRKNVTDNMKELSNEHIIWKIETLNNEKLLIDNIFRSFIKDERNTVLLVSSPWGERPLSDPSYSLIKALEVQGLDVKRVDRLSNDIQPYIKYNLSIVQIDESLKLTSYCPYSIYHDEEPFKKDRKIWLMPQGLQSGYKNVCLCFSYLALPKSKWPNVNKYCSDNMTVGEFNDTMKSLGASQIGGSVTEVGTSIGWFFTDHNRMLDIAAFSIPLTTESLNISHGYFPVLVSKILFFLGVIKEDRESEVSGLFPRIANYSALLGDQDDRYNKLMNISNVPLNESLLKYDRSYIFPRPFSDSKLIEASYYPDSKKKESPVRWIQLGLMLLLFVVFLESITSLVSYHKAKKKIFFLIIFNMLCEITPDQYLYAKVQIEYLSLSNNDFSARKIAQMTEERTSIEMFQDINFYDQLSSEVLTKPWLWVDKIALISNGVGVLKDELDIWLKKGGILILENVADIERLKILTRNFDNNMLHKGKWMPIPVDHEIMRSFYLLNGFPSCADSIWYGYKYDGRLAILTAPYYLLRRLDSKISQEICQHKFKKEMLVRSFINILMVAMTTDYKTEQTHIPEILKRINLRRHR